jgi:hypothetical protein
MTDIEKRLTAAILQREREVEIDEHAWQTHLQMAQGVAQTTAVRRWRSPVLVAAAVVVVGLLGGMLTQTGISGSGTVSPAGPGSGSVAPPQSTGSPGGTPMTTGPVPTGGGAPLAVPRSDRAATHGPTSSRDRQTSSRSAPATTSAAGRPDSAAAPSRATSAAIPMDGASAGDPPTMTSSPAGELSPEAHQSTTVTSGQHTEATSGPLVSGGVGQLVSVDGKVPCGTVLPPLDQEVSGLTLSDGPGGDVVNEAHQLLPVLAIGFALVSDDGRVASVSASDARIAKVTAQPLPPGRSSKSDRLPLTPSGVCPSVSPGEIWQEGQYDPPVFPVPAVPELQRGIYRAASVVLVGDDLAHAHAYQAGSIWQLSSG